MKDRSHEESSHPVAGEVPLLGCALLAPLAMASSRAGTTGAFRKDNSAPQIYSQEGWSTISPSNCHWGDLSPRRLTPGMPRMGSTTRISQKAGVNTQVPGSYVAQYQVKDDGLPAGDGFRGGEHHHHLLAAGHHL